MNIYFFFKFIFLTFLKIYFFKVFENLDFLKILENLNCLNFLKIDLFKFVMRLISFQVHLQFHGTDVKFAMKFALQYGVHRLTC